MRVRALDGNGDWLFGKGQNDYAQANMAIVFLIAMRLRSFLGDCFFGLTSGLDWFNLLGAKDQTALNLAIQAVILNTENVIGLKQVSILLDRKTRGVTIRYTAVTIYSSVSGTVLINPNAG